MIEKPNINMVPLIDIMLVLLTIVLTTSTFIASGRIPVNLPKASTEPSQTQHTLTIEINAGGAVYFEGVAVDAPNLKKRLGSVDKTTPLLLRADRSLSLQRFIDVADILKQLGFSKVAVQTQSGA